MERAKIISTNTKTRVEKESSSHIEMEQKANRYVDDGCGSDNDTDSNSDSDNDSADVEFSCNSHRIVIVRLTDSTRKLFAPHFFSSLALNHPATQCFIYIYV